MASTTAWRRWTASVAVFALLLKAAVPLLATAAAHLQGVAVAQICDVYGVRTVLPADPHDHASHQADAHAGHDHSGTAGSHGGAADASTHCVLVALGAMAAWQATAMPVHHAVEPAHAVPEPAQARRHDATALWVARMKHGPPPAA